MKLRFGHEHLALAGRRIARVLLLAGAALLASAPAGAAVRVVRFGVYRPGWGPGWGPWGGWGAPYYSPYLGPRIVVSHSNQGEVKFDTRDKAAQVFVNGAYAGTVRELKSLWLKPGSYNLEVREAGREPFSERIYVSSGSTLHVRPELPPAEHS